VPARLTDIWLVTALAAGVTLVLAVPVLRAPSERVFGAEIVGRHHDPFTAMQQFTRPGLVGSSAQPLTDVPGAMLTRVVSPVAAYNWLVLLSFPLTAAATFLLARHLALSTAGATVAALACAFSPFHLAHAGYHPHIAQVQWLPLYFLALWRFIDRPAPGRLAALAAATAAVTLSNLYGGLAAAVITPVAAVAYWAATRHRYDRPGPRLALTTTGLLLLGVAGLIYMKWALPAAVAEGAAVVATRADLFLYSAKWWSYLVPPVEHPLFGSAATRLWSNAGVGVGLLEQQVSLGGGIMWLGLIAGAACVLRRSPSASCANVAVLAVVALAALVCSLSPERTIGAVTFVRPSAWLYELVPMFRSYARFGVVVQLMAALLAGIGVDLLWQRRSWGARAACAALVALAAAEYTVWPPSLWRDALPTTAHRWVMQQASNPRVLDCTPRSQESDSIQWLTASRVIGPTDGLTDCAEPNMARKLAAQGFTHLLVRRDTAETPRIVRAAAHDHFQIARRFDDAHLYAVGAGRPAIYTTTTRGFSPREDDGDWSWRWMGSGASWVVVNTTGLAAAVTLDLEMSAFVHDRWLTLALNQVAVQELLVEPARRTYRVGPFVIQPGAHELRFGTAQPPTIADDVIHNGDRRALSFAVGTWSWDVAGDQR